MITRHYLTALERFAAKIDPGPWSCSWVHHHDGGQHPMHLVISTLVHGDETGPFVLADRLVDGLTKGTLSFGGRLTVLVGNPEAARRRVRYLDHDLNRVFAFPPGLEGREVERARALVPILESADLLVDFHQTRGPTLTPFYTFPWWDELGQWARVMRAAPIGITRPPNQRFAGPDQLGIDEFVRARGAPALCVELGQRGFEDIQEARGWCAIRALLHVADRIATGASTLEEEARRRRPLRWFTTVHREPAGSAERALRQDLKNGTWVRRGQNLARPGSPPVHAPCDGIVLFPKYPRDDEPRPTHLFHIAKPLDEPPARVFAATLGVSGGDMVTEDVLVSMEAAIQRAEEDERIHRRLATFLREQLGRQGPVDEEAVETAVAFVRSYIRQVPAILREALERSAGTFAEDKMRRMVEAAAAYWEAEDDVIPDDQGLFGILDDAYCSLVLIQALDERYAEQTGQRLVGVALREPNLAARRILGPTHAGQLEDYVDDALDDATLTELLDALQYAPAPSPAPFQTQDDLILKLYQVL